MANGVKKRIVKSPNGEMQVDLSGFANRVMKSLQKSNIKEVAEELGWDYHKVYGYLSLRHDPSPEFLVLIAKFTNRSLLWLLTEEGTEFVGGASAEGREERFTPSNKCQIIDDIVEALVQRTGDTDIFNLQMFVANFAKRNARFREMLTDISYERAEKFAADVDKLIEQWQEEDELRHQRLVADLKAKYESNIKPDTPEDEARLRASKPRKTSRRKKQG